MKEMNDVMKASVVSIIWNLALCGIKFLAGIFAHSAAMISDAVHSASDVFSTVVVMIGVKISEKEADENHPYGHERMECIAAIILAVVLAATGVAIGYKGVQGIIDKSYLTVEIPGVMALIAAVVSIAVKEGMYRYVVHIAKKEKSAALQADAWHHRSDALSSIGALVGIIFARLGFPVMDSIASIVICVFILKAALDVFKQAVNQVVDHSADKELEMQLRERVLQHPSVESISRFRTRMFGAKVYLDVEIDVNPELTLLAAHQIAEDVHDDIEATFTEVKHCMIHVNPSID